MKKGLFLGVAALCVFVACKEEKAVNSSSGSSINQVQEDTMEYVGDTLHLFDEPSAPPVTVDVLFDDFLFGFLDDPKFQRQRIRFPLLCKGGEEEHRISSDEWGRFNRFDTQDFYSIIYEREEDIELQKDTTLINVGIEWISLQEDNVERFDFNRIDGKWLLTEIEKYGRGSMPDRDFINFYSQFVSDSIFQRHSLAKPVRMILTPEDDEEELSEESVTADEWFSIKDELPLPQADLINIDYGQASGSQNRKTLMMCGLSNGLQMKFRFIKDEEGWKLTEIEY